MNTTYIIPIKVESEDRARNIKASVRYLLKNTNGAIIIKEVDDEKNVPQLLKEELKNERVTYLYEKYTGIFHRTKYLNDMLELVQTPIVCNYDADVILPPESYALSEKLILDNAADVVYPYPHSDTGQIQIFFTKDDDVKFIEKSEFSMLKDVKSQFCRAHAGFCFFIDREKYKRVGAEVEYFISYGPEDGERIIRFEKLGLKLTRLTDNVYHMEHERTFNSDHNNPYFQNNWRLHGILSNLSADDMRQLLKESEYMNNRNWSRLV